jgi:GNAT superfamily N-acetyltransferase
MPLLARTFVKASVIYLCLGAGIGTVLLVNRWVPLGVAIPGLRSSHAVFLVVGWLTQLILGVAWWMFPPLQIRLGRDGVSWSRHGQTQRGSEPLFWATFGLLNAGIISVRPAWRRQGLARALLTRALWDLRGRGVDVIRLNTVAEFRTRALDLYYSVGFRVLKEFPRHRKSPDQPGQPGRSTDNG